MENDIILDNIFYLLKEKRLLQSDFAKMIGVKPQVVTDWRKGRNRSYMKYLPEISTCLGVDFAILAGVPLREQSAQLNNELEEVVSNLKNNAPAEIDKSVIPEILKSFSTAELNKLSSLSRDQAAEVVKFVDDLLSHE